MAWFLALLLCGAAFGQTETAIARQPAPANLPAQRIGANDLIGVSVYGAPELSGAIRVGADGYIRMPMVAGRISADGLMPMDLESAIAGALRAAQILVDPIVTVTIVEYHSRPISVAGAVRRPITFQALNGLSLLEAINRAEGLSPEAGSEILVSRRQPDAEGRLTPVVERVLVKDLIDGADAGANLRLHGGEEIRVPAMGRVYVVGNVRRPGSFPVADAADTTVLKMLAHSEGLLPHSHKIAYIYRKEPATGAKNEIPIPLQQIMARKTSDVALQTNDVLYIPDNPRGRLGLNALERILGFGAATGTGILVFGR
jgi:polysaccharide export outer membrane protein